MSGWVGLAAVRQASQRATGARWTLSAGRGPLGRGWSPRARDPRRRRDERMRRGSDVVNREPVPVRVGGQVPRPGDGCRPVAPPGGGCRDQGRWRRWRLGGARDIRSSLDRRPVRRDPAEDCEDDDRDEEARAGEEVRTRRWARPDRRRDELEW